MIKLEVEQPSVQRVPAWLQQVLAVLGVARSSWYARPVTGPRRPGPAAGTVAPERVRRIEAAAGQYPWWGYKRIAVVLRRAGLQVSNGSIG
jgi:hypothetical protein